MCRIRLRIGKGKIPLSIAADWLDVEGDLVGYGVIGLFLEQRDIVLHLTVNLIKETNRLNIIGCSESRPETREW